MTKIKKIKAIVCSQNGKQFYLAAVPSSILKETCFISRREEDPKEGFQRKLNANRAKNIAKYLDSEKGCIPTSLILSAQSDSSIAFDSSNSELSFKVKEKTFLVLDGQHRLYGFFECQKDYSIPVVIFKDLKISEEVNLFIDINTNQKGVPATLILDIKDLAGNQTTLEEKQRALFDYLNKHSVLAGQFSGSTSKVGYISRVTFNDATKDLFENGYFADKEIDVVEKGVKNYLEAIDLIFHECESEKAKLNNSSLFKAVFAIFNECIDKTFYKHQKLRVDYLKEVLQPISNLKYDTYTGSSNSLFTKIVNDMRSQLNDYRSKYNAIDEDSIFE